MACLPEDPPPAAGSPATSADTELAGGSVYLDVSGSIQGYLRAVPGALAPEPLYDVLLARLPDVMDRMVQDPDFYFFGDRYRPRSRSEFLAARQASAYTDSTSDIGAVLRRIADRPGDTLNVVITDLFLSLETGAPSSNGPIFRPARDILRDGRAIALLAIRTPFAGTIFDIPGLPERSVPGFSGERPMFVLAAGPEASVVELTDRIVAEVMVGVQPKPYRRVVFSPNPVEIDGADGRFAAQPPADDGMDLLADALQRDLPTFTIDAAGPPAQLAMTIDPSNATLEDRLPPGANRFKAYVHAYFGIPGATGEECRRSWSRLEPSTDYLSVERLNSGEAQFRILPDATSMNRVIDGIAYVVDIELFASAPSADAVPAWMTEWGFRTERGRALAANPPDFFPALNLDLLGAVLAEAVAEQGGERRIAAERVAFELER